MEPLYQLHQRDCVYACIASLFPGRVDLKGFAKFDGACAQDIFKLTSFLLPECRYYEIDRCYGHRTINKEKTLWRYDYPEKGFDYKLPTEDFYIGHVVSPSMICPPESPYAGMRASHAVIMKGYEVVHDPSPNYKNHPYDMVLGYGWFSKRDTTICT